MDDFVKGLSTLTPESDTISPLPLVLRGGLTSVVVMACVSLFTSSLLFTHLLIKLGRYTIKRARRRTRFRQAKRGWANISRKSLDLSLGLDQLRFGGSSKTLPPALLIPHELEQEEDQAIPGPNQFVVLLCNLLLADMHQSVGFFLNVIWVAQDGILVRTSACWTQGFFISNGDLASSCFITTIALHTYLTLVREYKPPEWALNSWIVGMWVLIYSVTSAGIIATGNGKQAGGYYVRATAWVRCSSSLPTRISGKVGPCANGKISAGSAPSTTICVSSPTTFTFSSPSS